ncbi:uncharacterized protein E0L32_006397 [Thyridium curvatum]|uniref:Ubiquitin-like domain-containing protein n=1 Tax=Thyridium curvatum TaxID=1093900 RepID=A0A507B0E7_9PEZI|nr:uncharacterized protein E0L32_006397 [Thyridium curvatum]TPX13197.1 hypothetical protein E0L32_006397 [Thyridium curvatum]
MSKPTGAARPAPGQEPAVAVTVRSLRAGAGDAEAVRLPAQPAGTSLLDIKTAVAERLSLAPSRVRLLHRKKPVADSKVLKDLLGPGDSSLELSVMIMGGGGAAAAAAAATSTTSSSSPPPPVAGGEDVVGRTTAGGPTGMAVVEGPEFWNDLRGFLLQRVRDEKVTDEVFSLFLRAWEERS